MLHGQKEIEEINEKAMAEGLSYGQYVAREYEKEQKKKKAELKERGQRNTR